MESTMPLFTENDIKEYKPTFEEKDYPDLADLIAKTDQDIYRLLRVQWWPTYQYSTYSEDMDPTRLNDAQLKRSAVFYCLYTYLCPRYATFSLDGDKNLIEAEYFKNAFNEEFELVKREVIYDINDDGVIDDQDQDIALPRKLIR